MLQSGLVNLILLLETAKEYRTLFSHDTVWLYNLITWLTELLAM